MSETRVGGIVIKILIFVGIVFLLLWKKPYMDSLLEFETVQVSLLVGVSVYIILSLFGLLLRLTRNYVVSLIAFAVVFISGCTQLGKLFKSLSISNEITEYMFMIFGFIIIGLDIRKVVKTVSRKNTEVIIVDQITE